MIRPRLTLFFFAAAMLAPTPQAFSQDNPHVPYGDCDAIFSQAATDLSNAKTNNERAVSVGSLTAIAKHPTCFAQYAPPDPNRSVISILLQASNQKQRSSPTGSSASTSPISKPSGSNTIIQDVGGFSATNDGSAFTVQFAPGDMVNDFAKAGAIQYCTSSIHPPSIKNQKCVPKDFLGIASRATFSVTLNTNTTGSQISGTAVSSASTTQANLSNPARGLSFGGVSAKYAFLYLKNRTQTSTSNSPLTDAATALAKSENAFDLDLASCDPYQRWQSQFTLDSLGDKPNATAISDYITQQYRTLSQEIAQDATCSKFTADLSAVLTNVQIYQAAIAEQGIAANSKTPLLGLEYDFNTPASKPTYHSAKLNLSWQSAANCGQQIAVAAAKEGAARGVAKVSDNPIQGACGPNADKSGKSNSPTGSSVPPTPRWTISATAGADIYTYTPASTIPDGSRLRDVQAGAEITRVFFTSALWKNDAKLHQLMTTIGDLSLVGTYYYQDQTSPSILNGPPSSITFNGLPTTASQVYATRGPINIGQVRFGFGTGKSAHFPIAVSYSNRSDLIVHPFLGVQFGVSYDLSGK